MRAKLEGRWRRGQSLPGLPAEHYDLFPDRLVDSELGEIPEGWRVESLGAVADVKSGKRPRLKKPRREDGIDIPIFGGAGPMAYTSAALYSTPVLITGRVGTLGKIHRVTHPVWPSDNTLIAMPKRGAEFGWLFGVMNEMDLANLNRGSTQPLLTQSDLKTQLITVPDEPAISAFDGFNRANYERIGFDERESRALTRLRDTLLPKFVSGEVRVPEAERVVESVA